MPRPPDARGLLPRDVASGAAPGSAGMRDDFGPNGQDVRRAASPLLGDLQEQMMKGTGNV